jgi:hypothetical protein
MLTIRDYTGSRVVFIADGEALLLPVQIFERGVPVPANVAKTWYCICYKAGGGAGGVRIGIKSMTIHIVSHFYENKEIFFT